ncbi:hypothetical protein Tco_0576645 [Tanacetum coccineum]
MAFVSSNSTNSISSTIEIDNTANGVSSAHTQGNDVNSTSVDNLSDAVICAFLASQPNSPQLAIEDLEKIDPGDLEEMDLKWEMAMLTIRARRFIKRTCRNLDINGQRIGFDRSKVECFNCHKNGHFMELEGMIGATAEEVDPPNLGMMAYTSSGSSSGSDSEVDSCSKSCVKAYATLKEQYDNFSSDYKTSQFNLVSYKAGLGYNAVSPVVESFVNSYEMLKNQENDKSRSDKGYHAVPPPYIGNFMPPKPDLMFIDEQVESMFVDVVASSYVNTVESKHETVNKGVFNTIETNTVRKNGFSPLIIED